MAEPRDVSGVLAGETIVVYSVATGRVRRFMSSDRDEEIKRLDLATGEAFVKLSAQKMDLHQIQAEINALTGKVPGSDRYVVIDLSSGKVLNVIIADPLCGDAIKDCLLVPHESADDRWSYDVLTGVLSPPAPVNPRESDI